MVLDILCTIIGSLIIIYLFDYFYNYFKNKFTVPKIKDLVKKPKKDYEAIYEIINSEEPEILEKNQDNDILSNDVKQDMNEAIGTTNISDLNFDSSKDEIVNELNNLFNEK